MVIVPFLESLHFSALNEMQNEEKNKMKSIIKLAVKHIGALFIGAAAFFVSFIILMSIISMNQYANEMVHRVIEYQLIPIAISGQIAVCTILFYGETISPKLIARLVQ